ncbi:dimethylaniline monooxygenase [N-oxide-forming] 2-like [Ylistrum balloti]|uniref:dimethylaniline monooxygenase [N-oxide-forming] 2-like n=1 Tax=Ylistrum balloti TaxID=509963 RepID=UPI002905B86C|nr:dimethylaniline monooxygenase [N-oxide-forming] 2-like [Ylistrum balloti]
MELSDFEKTWIFPVSNTDMKIAPRSEDRFVNRKKIAVIGAGVSGLCALKHLTENLEDFVPTAFEKLHGVGGIWSYTETAFDECGNPTHSGVYNNLMTNGPKELVMIPGYPHKQTGISYLHHTEMLEYIKGFTKHFHLDKYVKFNTVVKSVRPVQNEGDQVKWDVTYCDRYYAEEIHTNTFDGVIICNGNYSKCHIPNVKGIENFTGHVIHSRDYRTPEVYQGQRVLILGASFSGLDITFDLSKNAAQIYIGHRKDKMQIKLPANVSERPDVSHLDVGNKVVFLDGSETEVDSIIFCTGYSYDFPFLADDTIQVKDERIKPLYKHLVHIKYHNLFFVGITRHVSYFMQAHEQAKAAVAILKGGIQLPSEQAMLEDAEREFQQKRQDYGMSHLHAHYLGMGDLEWKLNKDHAELCGFEPLPPVLKSIMEHVKESRSADFCNFRKKNYFFKDAQHFGVID